MFRFLSQLVALVLAVGFIANAQCAASCLFTRGSLSAHACCKHGKASQPKPCANRVSPFKDAVLKARANAEMPQFTAYPASLAAVSPLPQMAGASVSELPLNHPPGPPPLLCVLRI